MSIKSQDSNNRNQIAQGLAAIANPKRLQILEWLIDPIPNFEPQMDGDLVLDGVCVGRITDKIGLSQPTVTSHMKVMQAADLVSSKKIKNWVFYKPKRAAILRILDSLNKSLG